MEKLCYNIDPLYEVSTKFKSTAGILVRKIGIMWTENGELLVDGTVIEGSDIRKIIKYHFQKKGVIPMGYRAFLLLLDKEGITTLKPPGFKTLSKVSTPQKPTSQAGAGWISMLRKK